MYNRSLKEPSSTYTSGGTSTQELSRGGICHFYACKLKGTLTLAGANNTRAKTKRGDALALIKKLRIRLNAQENVYELDGASIIKDNEFLVGKKPYDLDGTLADGATANPTFQTVFLIPFSVPRRLHKVPVDTSLDLRPERVNKVEVQVDWNTHTDVNGDATAATATLTIESQKSYGVKDITPGFLRRYLIAQTLAATNARELVKLPATEAYYALMLNTTDAAVDSTAILNNIKLRSGSNVFEEHDPVILSDGYGRLWHGEERSAFSGAAFGFLAPMLSTSFKDRAWYPLRIPVDGNLREMQPAQGLPDFALELDATIGSGTTVINVVPYQYVVPVIRG